jgi:poly-gamma-glutamate capsule biosynthesis protein CapA/YwtB (metallophosphatase superfamily)
MSPFASILLACACALVACNANPLQNVGAVRSEGSKEGSSKPGTVRLIFVGDLMLDGEAGRTVAAGGDPLALVDAALRDADYAVGNLECPIATVGQPVANKLYTFRAHPRVLRVLQGRLDAVSVANNHSGDYGREAFSETLLHLRSAGIAAFGGGSNLRQAHAPLWIERNGLQIAVLGYNDFLPRSFEAGPTWPGIAWSEDDEVVSDIRSARLAGADVVIPFMHWGWEGEPAPSQRQRSLARLMIDAGADAVVGSHPHLTQGATLYRGRPIVWSLGNFVFDGFESAQENTGWLLRLTLDSKGVVAWRTMSTHMDDAGTPRPMPRQKSPCGSRAVAEMQSCAGIDSGP